MSFLENVAFEGMKVIMKMDKESRGWGRQGPPNGTVGVLISRKRIQQYSENFGHDMYFREPGIYEMDGPWLVKMDKPYPGNLEYQGILTDIYVGTGDFEVHPDDLKAYTKRADDLWYDPVIRNKTISWSEQEVILQNKIKVSDLPETKCWLLDTVILKEDRGYGDEEYKFVVSNIDRYYDIDEQSYTITAYNDKGNSCFSTSVRDSGIKEIIRGNVWKYYHNEKLVFENLSEEAAFFKGMGQARDIRNPKDNLYSWTLEEFLEAVKNDLVDCMSNDFIPLTDKRSINAYRYTDRNLGERLRQATIKGFNLEQKNKEIEDYSEENSLKF